MLTRKHFRKAAEILRTIPTKSRLTRRETADLFVEFFKEENPRFKAEAFLDAIETAEPELEPDALDTWARLRENHGTDL